MQIKDKYLNLKSTFWFLIKFVAAALALFFIHQKFTESEVDLGSIAWPDSAVQIIFLVLLLMIVNWVLESFRWMISIRVFERISFLESLSSVLGGLALNWIMPFTMGDAAFRLALRQDKYSTTSAIVVNRSIMILLTSIYGAFSVHYFSQAFLDLEFIALGLVVLGGVSVWLSRKYLSSYLSYFHKIQAREFFAIGGISAVRYAVFVLQFYLLLTLFLPKADPLLLFMGIGWVFFFKSIIPSLLGGLGVREASGLVFFSDVTTPELVVIPIFLIWAINTALPSVIGLIFIWTQRFFPGKE